MLGKAGPDVRPYHYSDINEHDGVSNHQPHDYLLTPFIQAKIIENIKVLRHRPLWEEFIGDQWIPRTKGP